ncbi:hypothetical protein SAMN04488544_3975 [Microlunatus sagamiharensis]|uniref:DUF4352 domain-containing protein n=1 Tax=Microlunatus sagamiharensis TaxID=546874 RepID=A0A1H2NG18_9ACTN|nr:hypothetical protein [Microlunatus sagamiharensis]SDV04437.1 hypothetical protein SAMN04488544_3975 [Microlunatus sagamiharensis]
MNARAFAPARLRAAGRTTPARAALVAVAALLVCSACSAEVPSPSPVPTPNQPSVSGPSASEPSASVSPAAPSADPQEGPSPSATPSGPPDPAAPKTFKPVEREGGSEVSVAVASASSRQARWSDGLRLEVVSAKQTTATGSGPGSTPGSPQTVLGLRLVNASKSTVDVSGAVLSMPYGRGTRLLAPRVYPDGAQDFSGRLEPGASGRATYAFTLPRTQRSSADLVVDLDGVHALATLKGVAR